ncbi:MAG: 4Fe-4S binding protein [Ignavibacteriaceae bacterium]|nr:4Fe-4S binding protein [Ignavibacteriaceae bacterium]
MTGKKKLVKNTEKPIQKYRFTIQVLFALLCIWIGIEFYFFINYLESGGAASYTERPPGVDGFLPISSLMSFYLFLATGQIHSAHPAGFFIFFAIILVSLVFGKAFCSWLCPIGFLSELIADFGEKIFKRKIKLPKWLDYPLRSLKYLMLGFLFYAVFIIMSEVALKAFLDSPYNLVSDIKMYYFFANISQFSLIVIGILFLMSIVIRNFWCRYLCPYGALLGITALLSPSKIKRNADKCVDCGLCNNACPGFIKVDKVKTVISDECTTCMNCVDVCPVDNTLQLETVGIKKKINKRYVAIGIVSLFMIITGAGLVTGNWQNDITKDEFLYHYKKLDTYGHPTSTESVRKFNEEQLKDSKKSSLNNSETNRFLDPLTLSEGKN